MLLRERACQNEERLRFQVSVSLLPVLLMISVTHSTCAIHHWTARRRLVDIVMCHQDEFAVSNNFSGVSVT